MCSRQSEVARHAWLCIHVLERRGIAKSDGEHWTLKVAGGG